MNDFQRELQMLNLGDYQATPAVSWDPNQYYLDQDRQFIGVGVVRCFSCFSCFNCSNCFSCFFSCFSCFGCSSCGGRCGGGRCGGNCGGGRCGGNCGGGGRCKR